MKDRIYVITGATSGIGKALVEVLSENNLVFAGYRSEDKKEELSKISSNVINSNPVDCKCLATSLLAI